MSGKRAPAPPPQLPGFTYVDLLGSGGFADVYLYEQHLPRRRVAVKVLLPDRMSGGAAEQFAAEANVMALLSTHPAIVTIYQAGVSDDNRPYLVMEYCPRPNLQVRSRAAAFSVAEALRVGVQVAAAVETAHRAGILHRDIKPANILVTEYNRPALTDFGIATTADSADAAAGMSIPWSPPESFSDDPESGIATDVYALGATVYTLLAGHSPFEQPGGHNGSAELIARIERDPLPRLDRGAVPASLQTALARAMAKRPADRFDSAVAFARALQKVQIELNHSVTPIDILDDAPVPDADDEADGELTRVRGIVSIEPQTAPSAGATHRRDTAEPAPGQTVPDADDDTAAETVLRGARPAPVEHTAPAAGTAPAQPTSPSEPDEQTVRRAPAPAPLPDSPAAVPPRPRSRRALWIGLAVVVVAAVVTGIAVIASLSGAPVPTPAASTSAPDRPQDPLDGYIPAPTDLAGTVAGDTVTFTWTNPEPRDGDAFIWYPVTPTSQGDPARVTETTVEVPADPSGTTCIAVQLVRADGRGGEETKECAS